MLLHHLFIVLYTSLDSKGVRKACRLTRHGLSISRHDSTNVETVLSGLYVDGSGNINVIVTASHACKIVVDKVCNFLHK